MRASSLLSRLLCASSAPWRAAIPPQCAVRGVSSLNLFFERPVRNLLNADGPRRKESLELPESEPPLQAVRAALRRRMPDEALDIVTIRHGKRPVETDDDCRAVLERARQALQTILHAPLRAQDLVQAAVQLVRRLRQIRWQRLVHVEKPHQQQARQHHHHRRTDRRHSP